MDIVSKNLFRLKHNRQKMQVNDYFFVNLFIDIIFYGHLRIEYFYKLINTIS